MSHNVFANGMEVSCKASSGKTICNFPDVCFTPPLTPATPPGVPIPYPNTGMASDTTDGSSSVKFAGEEVMLKNKSCFKQSTGDEAGSAAKKGVVTSKNMGKVYFNAWSMDVKVEGENVPRNLDITTNNHAAKIPGNTPPMPHVSSVAMAPSIECEPCKANPGAGNPVNPILGCKFLAGEDEIDFTVDGPLPLEWQRNYFSDNARVGWHGQGWACSFDVSLDESAGLTTFVDHQGRRVPFPRLVPGESSYRADEKTSLVRISDDEYRLVFGDGATFVFVPFALPKTAVSWRLQAIVDANENRISFGYDTLGRLAELQGSAAQRLRLVYNAGFLLDAVQEVRDSGDVITLVTYTYTAEGDLWRVVDRAGRLMREFTWRNHVMRSHRNASGLVSNYQWDVEAPDGKVVRQWTNTGREQRFEYLGDRTVVRDELNRMTQYLFDAGKRWIGTVDPKGRTHRRVLDRAGQVVALVDPSGRASREELNERGLPSRRTGPDGAITELEWHPRFDLPVKFTDAMGRTYELAYDDRGNLLRSTDPAGSTWLFDRDARGLATAVTGPSGRVQRYVYDSHARLTLHVDCAGNRTELAYDADGSLVEVTNALGEKQRFEYTPSGDVAAEIAADGTIKRWAYDKAGRIVQEVEADGTSTSYEWRLDDLPHAKIDPLGQLLSYRYDAAGRLVELINENGASHAFAYDELNRLITEATIEGTRRRYEYDASDDLVAVREGAADDESAVARSESTIISRFSRDVAGRLTQVQKVSGAGSQTIDYRYNAVGEVVEATNASASLKFEYDARGLVTLETTTLKMAAETATAAQDISRTVTFLYDDLGNRTQMNCPDGTKLQYLYAGSCYLHQIACNGISVADLERDALFRVTRRTQGRVETSQFFDPVGRLVRKTISKTLPASPMPRHAGAQESVLSDNRYTYSLTGHLLREIGPDVARAFQYDALGRIIVAAASAIEERFAYDPASNPVAPGAGPVFDNKVREYEGTRYTYDHFGRVVEKTVGGKVIRLFWNELHQLRRSETSTRGIVQTTEYEYDALGRRIAKHGRFGSTHFVWDGDTLLQERTGARTRTYVCEPFEFSPIAIVEDGETLAVEGDLVGSPRKVRNVEAAAIWETQYTVWGNAVAVKALPGSGTRAEATSLRDAVEQPLRMPGQYFDVETGLHYNRARYFDPDIGRFLAPDPIGLLGGPNVYSYAVNPFEWIDPLGLKNKAWIEADGCKKILKICNKFTPGSALDRQTKSFVKAWNEEIKTNGGTMTRRQETAQEKKDSAAYKKEKRDQYPCRFAGKVVGHVPDACAGGPSRDGPVMALSTPVNAYFGGILGGIAVGASYNSVKLVRC